MTEEDDDLIGVLDLILLCISILSGVLLVIAMVFLGIAMGLVTRTLIWRF